MKTKNYPVNERCVIKMSKRNSQQCIFCGGSVSEQLAISFNNKTDDMALKKNLWLHISCFESLTKAIRKTIKKNRSEIVSRLI
jgi:hypothetical protein